MYPILARFGPFLIYSYEFVLAIGIGACIGLVVWLTREKGHLRTFWVDGLLLSIILALVGGRIVFVLSEYSYYLEEPGEIWLVWRGGLSYHGALIAGLAALWLWTRWRDHNFRDFIGFLAPPLALISIFGWFACWLEGCAYGKEAAIGLLSGDLPDSYGVYGVRYQTQLMGLVLSAAVFAIVIVIYRRLRPLQIFWFTVAALAAGRLIVTLFRGDEAPMIGSIRLDTAADGVIALVALIGLAFTTFSRSSRRSV
jgi:phosphatidylglycerol:prolipoprotein diacylglycerol transferase